MKKYFNDSDSLSTSQLLRIWVWMQICCHVLYGLCTLTFIFPFLTRKVRDKKIQKWSRRLLKIFNIELVVHGADLLENTPHLIASNHISWVDIHVINAFRPILFVAKSEVAAWPIFGWMAKQLGTVFIRRDSARHARLVVTQMADLLKTESICIFPEGTSTIGEIVLPFKANLFESAIVAQAPVYPLAIRYLSTLTGRRSDAPGFIGDMGLLESMSNIIQNRSLIAQITILAPCVANQIPDRDRKKMAIYCQESISQTL